MTNFMISLSIMWKGMLGIFTFIILIMLVVMLLSKITSGKAKDEELQNK